MEHSALVGREKQNQHPIAAISNLTQILGDLRDRMEELELSRGATGIIS